MRRILFYVCCCLCSFAGFCQTALTKVTAYRKAHEQEFLQTFFRFLELPNIATDTAHIGANADFLTSYMTSLGIRAQLLHAEGSPPVVYGEVKTPGATRTVVFYAHYDGQPVNASLWNAGLHPFRPRWTRRIGGKEVLMDAAAGMPANDDDRIYARGSSDDKGGVMAILAAYNAIQKTGQKAKCNIKFFFEGEEEQGSPHLAAILRNYKELLQSDLWIICDGPVHQSGRKQVVYGVRGDAHLTLKVYGPLRPLHSGHYGNWVPNPVQTLVKLLASLKDSTGKVAVKGFYDDVTPLTPMEWKALDAIPNVDAQLKTSIGFAEEEITGKDLIHSIHLPSLNINGIESSNVGTIQANVIPISATAVLDLRLVPGNDWQRQQQKVIDHIQQLGFYVTEGVPDSAQRARYPKLIQITRGFGDNAYRTPMDWPVAQQVIEVLNKGLKEPVLQVPTLGGTLPLNTLVKELGARPLVIPIANPDNNQHAENENIQLKHLREGIDMLASLMLGLQ